MACLIPAPLGRVGVLEGIFTGGWMLACVSLPAANGKAGTKPVCLWSFVVSSRHFQCLALVVKLH